ncbi:unnamed protein product, partial [Callosobruchus maculatus]
PRRRLRWRLLTSLQYQHRGGGVSSLTPAGCCPRQTLLIPGMDSASRRLLQAATLKQKQAQQEPQFVQLPAATSYQPSRKREEARTLQNLRRTLQAVRVLKENRAEPIEASQHGANNNLSPEEIDNRPYLLQKVLFQSF